MSYSQNRSSFKLWPILLAFVVFLFSIIILFTTTTRVDNNAVGVVEHGGAVDTHQTPLSPGWHNITPFVDGVVNVQTNQQSHVFSEVQTAAGNQQNVYVDGTVSYHVDPKYAAEMVVQTGGSGDPTVIIQRILFPAFQDYLKERTPQEATYSDVLKDRASIRDDVRNALRGKTDQYGLFVDDIYLTNIHPDKSYQDAIQAAAVAQQQLITSQNQANARVASAEGDAKANAIKQQTITPQVIQQEELDNQKAAIEKWDGKFPSTMAGTSNPFAIFQNPGR